MLPVDLTPLQTDGDGGQAPTKGRIGFQPVTLTSVNRQDACFTFSIFGCFILHLTVFDLKKKERSFLQNPATLAQHRHNVEIMKILDAFKNEIRYCTMQQRFRMSLFHG